MVDADRIAHRLWQGSDPPKGAWLRRFGIDVLVLCAAEKQHSPLEFPGVKVIHAPMDDGSIVPERTAMDAAAAVVREHKRGKRVLVCCAMGWNRSGLVSALALWLHSGDRPGWMCMKQVQKARDGALFNLAFTGYLASLPPRRQMAA